jgi:hypothetical protein
MAKPQIDPARDTELQRLAKRIANRLFRYDKHSHAERLVMSFSKDATLGRGWEYWPGWSESGAQDAILEILRCDEIAGRRKK